MLQDTANAPQNGALPLVVLIATGGTIAQKIDPVKQAPVPALSGEDLLAAVPEVGRYARLEVQDFANIPSDYMGPAQWVGLQHMVQAALARPDTAAVVISHGTDTLEETAWFLDLTLDSTKPVVMTGAQRHASSTDFDGPRNLLEAVRVALAPEAQGQGVLVVLNSEAHAARSVTKAHTTQVEAFRSGPPGCLAEVYADRVVFYRTALRRLHVPLCKDALPYVEIVAMYGGADGAMIHAALRENAEGIVVQGLGAGNVNEPVFRAMETAIEEAVPVVISTRVPGGRVLPHYGWVGGGQTLREAGVISADDLSPPKARILLMLLLQVGATDPAVIQAYFSR